MIGLDSDDVMARARRKPIKARTWRLAGTSRLKAGSAFAAAIVTAVVALAIPALALPSAASAWEWWCYPGPGNLCGDEYQEGPNEYTEVNGPEGWLFENYAMNESGVGVKGYLWHYAKNVGKWQVVAYAGSSNAPVALAFTEGRYSWRSHGQVTHWYEYKYHLYGQEFQCGEYKYKEKECAGLDVGE